jgi:intergrase/recombinase
MQRFFNPELTLDVMIHRIKEMKCLLPSLLGKIVNWGVLVELRVSEIIESVRLINDKEAFPKYYDAAQMTLSHWKMPDMIRSTKKAFLSYVTPEMLEPIQNLGVKKVPTYGAIRHVCDRRGIVCNLHLSRKVFASYLHESGLPDITIDMLQGRVPRSVLAQHYVVPNTSLKDKVIDVVTKLQKEIEN